MASVLVEPRSLLVLQDSLYHSLLHGIEPVCEDKLDGEAVLPANLSPGCTGPLRRTTRVSLTIRHVPRTSKLKLKLGR